MSPCENDTPINWKRNLIVAWLGRFLTGAAFSLVMPFLPLYVEQLGVTGHSALNMWSGIVFSITFLFSAIASPFWGGLADRKGRKLMLLRSALGMGIVMVLMGLAQNIWQFLILRALLGLLGGFVPNANALIATQVPRNKSGWALGTLSTGGVSGALLGPMAGGLLADSYGLRPVFFITASVLILCFFVTLFCIREKFQPVSKKEMLHMREVVTSLKNPKLVLSLFVTTLIIQVATGSIAPILTLYVRELAGNVSNVAFISGMIASVPGVAALLSAPRLGKLGDRIGPKNPDYSANLFCTAVDPNVLRSDAIATWDFTFFARCRRWCTTPRRTDTVGLQLEQPIAGRIFSYNQSFRDIGNVTGPLMGAAISANYGFRAVFLVTAGVVLFNAVYSWNSLRRRRIPRYRTDFSPFILAKAENQLSFSLKPHQLKGRIVMTMYATLEEAIDAAREEFLADNPGIDAEDANVQQFNAQKYVLQDGDIMWQVEFFADEGEEGECLPMLSGEAAQSVFDGDYDEIEIREWQEENTLHEWDEGEFQLEPPLDTEEGRAAADEWDER